MKKKEINIKVRAWAQEKLLAGKPVWLVFEPGLYIDLRFPFIHKGYICKIQKFSPVFENSSL